MSKFFLPLVVLFVSANHSWARNMPQMRTLPKSHPTVTYDISASSGTENNYSYSEIKFNVNWYLADWLNWRNGLFTRFGSQIESINGLDSSLLAIYQTNSDDEVFGAQAFIGPGLRVASRENNAATAEAGVIFKLGGIQLGGGAKYLSYFKTRQDQNNLPLPKDETQYFIVLMGGGSL